MPDASLWFNLIPAFLVGGLLCVCAQLLMDLTKPQFTPAHVLIIFVVAGAFAGAMVLSIINNILNMLKVFAYYQYIIKSLILILALLIFQLRRRKSA